MIVYFLVDKDDSETGFYVLQQLTEGEVFWGTSEVEDAVESLRANSDDLALDAPMVDSQLSTFVAWLAESGLVSKEFAHVDAQYVV